MTPLESTPEVPLHILELISLLEETNLENHREEDQVCRKSVIMWGMILM